MFDTFIRIAYDELNGVREVLDKVPVNNSGLYKLKHMINQEYNENIWRALNQNTSIFRLSYKTNAIETDENGSQTFYGYLKQKYLPIYEAEIAKKLLF